MRDATHVLDGLLYHESDLRIEEHYTDTAAFTDHVFALCQLLGFAFAPRIADLADKTLYVPGKASQWPALQSLISTTPLQLKLSEKQFPRSPSQMTTATLAQKAHLRRLARGHRPRQTSIGVSVSDLSVTIIGGPPRMSSICARCAKANSARRLQWQLTPPHPQI